MDLRKLKAFIVVAEELNFRRSAEILGMSQPPLTRLISSFEDEIGVQLFERTTRKVKLTGAGVFLLKEGREVLDRTAQLEKEIRAVAKQKTGSLTIGFSTTAFLASLPKIIEEFRESYPQIRIDLQQESRKGLSEGLRHGRYDACFLEGDLKAEGLEGHLVKDEALGVLLPKGHPLARRKEVDLLDLKEETFILHPRREHEAFFDNVKRICEKSGFKPKIHVKTEQESCPILVAFGKGISLSTSRSQNFSPTDTRFVPVRKLYLPVSIFWQKEHQNPTLRSFLSFVIENAVFERRDVECLFESMRLNS